MEVFREPPGSAALSSFCKQDALNREFSNELRNVLEVTAMTGLYWHKWDELKILLSYRLEQVLRDYYKSHANVAVGPPRPLITGESYQELEDRLTSGLDSFVDGAPFTIQRLCEVLLNPRDRYPNLDKVALAFEKLLLVTSTVPPSSSPFPETVSSVLKEEDKLLKEPSKVDDEDTMQEFVEPNVDLPSRTEDKEGSAAVSAPDEEMVDVESTEAKEPRMEVDESQISETTTAGAGEASGESEVKPVSAGVHEQSIVEASANQTEALVDDLQNDTMVDSTPD